MERDIPAKLGYKRTGSLTHKGREGEYAIHYLAVDLLRLSTVERGSAGEEEGETRMKFMPHFPPPRPHQPWLRKVKQQKKKKKKSMLNFFIGVFPSIATSFHLKLIEMPFSIKYVASRTLEVSCTSLN